MHPQLSDIRCQSHGVGHLAWLSSMGARLCELDIDGDLPVLNGVAIGHARRAGERAMF